MSSPPHTGRVLEGYSNGAHRPHDVCRRVCPKVTGGEIPWVSNAKTATAYAGRGLLLQSTLPLGTERFCMHASCCTNCLIRHSHTRSVVRARVEPICACGPSSRPWLAGVQGEWEPGRSARLCVCRACAAGTHSHACHTRSVEQYACGYSSQSHILCAGPYNTAYVSVSTTRVYRCEPAIHC